MSLFSLERRPRCGTQQLNLRRQRRRRRRQQVPRAAPLLFLAFPPPRRGRRPRLHGLLSRARWWLEDSLGGRRKINSQEIRPHALVVSLYLMVLYCRSDKGSRLLADVKRLLAEILVPGSVNTTCFAGI